MFDQSGIVLLLKVISLNLDEGEVSQQKLLSLVAEHLIDPNITRQTDWEGGHFPLTLHFTEDYPSRPPECKFPAGFFHVNVYNNTGSVCLSILGGAWKPSITVRQILIGIQDLLDNPNPASPAQRPCYDLFTKDMPEYKNRVSQQAKRYPSLV